MTVAENGFKPAHVADIPGRSMLVLYGSETGNSQDIAEELGRNAQRLHFKAKVEEMNAVQLSALLQYTLVVFVISTTGQGDMPRSSVIFWKSLLRRKLPPGCLGAVKFTTFGLGDSMYIKFNWAAKKLHKRLEQLGAQEFYPRGEADERDDDGADERYLPWVAGLQKKLLELHPLPTGLSPISDDELLPPRYSINLATTADTKLPSTQSHGLINGVNGLVASTTNGTTATAVESLVRGTSSITLDESPSSNMPPTTSLPIPTGQLATLDINNRVTPSTHFQDVREIRLTLPSNLAINPFDSLTIYPKNFPSDVQKLIDLMSWSDVADLPLSLPATLPRGLHVQPNPTLRSLLTHNLDITSIPRRSFLKEMSYFIHADLTDLETEHPDESTGRIEARRLRQFCRPENRDELYDYTTRPRRTILEVLDEFTTVRIPLSRVLDVFPVVRGRDFSIASVAHPTPTSTSVQLLVALVKYRTVLRRIRQGLCSRYLESLSPGASLTVTFNTSSAALHGSSNARRPLVGVATGTGVAPLRLFVEERFSYADAGFTTVFFGNRSRHADFHYQNVWETIRTQNPNKFAVHTAFSRDTDKPREYVQDVIRNHAADIRNLVAKNAIFVVCGGSLKMSRAVKEAVKACLAEDQVAFPDEGAVEAAFGRLTWWEEIW
ncbi:NADPH-dependent diflavin oxidoreductase 1 [Colletotrichum spinosum]|uniref:NADPH-dependent diflavin oxidoreductase 1 n=1 Tax=Colletotrichum spinosum TaxID=1347390 RepID=A0A4R8Q9I1_9PEZI|nr:NADPH-dependent diflavin oxidoreductase 1 [Colletotrichum spinosum]